MIKVKTKDDRFLEVSGHAGAGPEGQDIVCAGVSGIIISASGAVEDRRLEAVEDIRDGYYRLKAEEPAVCLVIAQAVSGLKRVAELYPAYIDFES